jgi:hypothetical protein
VFALFWLLITVHLELIAIKPVFIFFYASLGAVGAGELNLEYDYAADDYSTTGLYPTDSEIPISHCYVVC